MTRRDPRRTAGHFLAACATTAFFAPPQDALAVDWVSAEQHATGGVSAADPRDLSNNTANPALMSFVRRWDVGGFFVGGPQGELGWTVAAIDGRTNEFVAFGITYSGGLLNRPFRPAELPGWAAVDETVSNERQVHDITFGIAIPISQRRFSFGINGTVNIFDGPFIGPGVTGNLDFGFAANPVEYVTVGLVGRDILPIEGQTDQPATLALAVRGGKEGMIVGMAELDTRLEEVDGDRFTVRAGIEGGVKFARFRGGWTWQEGTPEHDLTLGIGAQDDRLGSIDYGIRIPLAIDNFDPASMTHVISLTLYTKIGDKDYEEAPIRWKDGG